jgi:tRNA-Thr(GGU) m(6)t(6)A37 methyltransferase TsaA
MGVGRITLSAMSKEEFVMRPIGTVRSCYPEKFGVPRQSGLVPSATAELIFTKACRRAEAVRGLEGFSHLWLVFVFDQVSEDETRLSVRPPRLGGNEKLGVFATRSPFRPNRIGLSVVRLEGVDEGGEEGPVLRLSGVDLVDGTPILDVKPYVPYADALPEAVGGFANEAQDKIPVTIGAECRNTYDSLPEAQQTLICETLSLDPRPSYRSAEDDRLYHILVSEFEVAWRRLPEVVEVVAIASSRGEAS